MAGLRHLLHTILLQLVQPIRPVTRTRASKVKAYEIVDDRYLEENAEDWHSRQPLTKVTNPENVVAILCASSSTFSNLSSLTAPKIAIIPLAGPTLPLTTVQEVNELSAQLRQYTPF